MDSRGFTLLELLIASIILTLAFVGLGQALGTGSELSVRSENRLQALAIARSRLAAVGRTSALDHEVEAGAVEIGDKLYRWRLTTRQRLPHAEPTRDVMIFDLQVTVIWRQGLGRSRLSLSTMRLAGLSGMALL